MWVLGHEQMALYLVASQSAPVPQGGRPGHENCVSAGLMAHVITCVDIIGAGVNTPAWSALTLLVKVTI